MDRRGETGTALAAVAAVGGTGYASGRELVLFFAQTGWAGWIGIAFASVVFGLLMALLCHWAGSCQAGDYIDFCRRLMGRRAGSVAGWLYALLLAMTAAVILSGAGELGALTLPLAHGRFWGALLALGMALLLNLKQARALPALGLALLLTGALFYGALAFDAQPPRIPLRGSVQLSLEGSWPAAILLGLAYAAMKAPLAGGLALRFGGGARPARVGLLCGGMLGALLACANAAVARGGRLLLAQAMPTVLLSARWGAPGFWLCAGFGFLCAVSTLTAVLVGLIDLLRWGGRQAALLALALAALACGLGLHRFVGAGYPALGWLCGALMLVLACRAESRLLKRPDAGRAMKG